MIKGEMIIIGAGTHARIVYDILFETPDFPNVSGFIDVYDNPELKGAIVDGKPVLGNGDIVESIYKKGITKAIIALGDNALRKQWFEKASAIGFEIVSAIHPDAFISRRAKLGRGVMVSPGAVICTGAEIGDGVIVNTSASIDHDCRIGSFSHVAPGAHLAGRVTVGELSHIGIGSSIIQGKTIGSECIIGAGAAVIHNLPDKVTAYGVPAKPKK